VDRTSSQSCSSLNNSVTNSDCVASNDSIIVNNELQIGRKQS
jgi:hypothetical protein